MKLGNYKGLKVHKNPVAVSAEEVEKAISLMRQSNTRNVNVDRDSVEQGDIAVIDYEGFVDGVAFEGGKDQGYALEIGSGTFIPGFEEGLVGATVGQDVDVVVTFPTEYHADALAGKEAVFKCKVNAIQAKEVPELDEKFVKEVSEFDNVADFTADVEKNLLERKKHEEAAKMQESVLDMLIDSSELDVTDDMVKECLNEMMGEFEQSLQRQGMSMEMYMQFTGMTAEEFAEQSRPQAEKRAKMNMVLSAIAEAEHMVVTEEDFATQIAEIAAQYNAPIEQIQEALGARGKEAMMQEMAHAMAFDYVMNNLEVVEA